MDAMTDYNDLRYAMYREADRQSPSDAIDTLITCYKRYECMDTFTNKVINNDKAVKLIKDYWAYVKWAEHGNECCMDEIGGIKGFIDIFERPEPAIEYLMYDDYDKIDDDARDLISRIGTIYASLL